MKYKEFKVELQGITSENQKPMKPGSLSGVMISLFFNFIPVYYNLIEKVNKIRGNCLTMKTGTGIIIYSRTSFLFVQYLLGISTFVYKIN